MKKSTIITTSLIAALALLGGTGYAVLNNAAAISENTPGTLIAVNTDLGTTKINTLSTKDETVYLITDAAGSVKNTFIGNTLYDGSASLPVKLKITYYLDGAEIDPADLAGKSGHVKIRYSYETAAQFNGSRVPFLAVTGTILDGAKFTNVSVNNGKIMAGDSDYTIVGYAVAGLNENLGTDLLPSTFEIEADVVSFELGTTYTLLSNNIFADLDTSKLSSIDDLVNAMNQLNSGLNDIISGASDLSNGLETLLTKSQSLKAGIDNLASHNAELTAGAAATFNIFLSQASAATGQTLTIENYAATLDAIIANLEKYGQDATEVKTLKASLDKYNEFYEGLLGYTTGVAELSNNMPALIAGETELYNGSVKLNEGLNTFKTTGLDKLVNLANDDLASLAKNLRASVSAAKSYTNFAGKDAESVKFIVKTASIK